MTTSMRNRVNLGLVEFLQVGGCDGADDFLESFQIQGFYEMIIKTAIECQLDICGLPVHGQGDQSAR